MRYDNAKDRALVLGLELSVADLTAQQFQSGYTYNIPWGVIISLETRPFLMVSEVCSADCLSDNNAAIFFNFV